MVQEPAEQILPRLASTAALEDQGFAALDASQMSAADKQAAFERMVLGESSDVLDLEMATLQASPRKQSLSTTALDTTMLREASRRSPHSPHSPAPLAGIVAGAAVEVQHVVSFEGSVRHLDSPKAVQALTLPAAKTSSTSEAGPTGCCLVS